MDQEVRCAGCRPMTAVREVAMRARQRGGPQRAWPPPDEQRAAREANSGGPKNPVRGGTGKRNPTPLAFPWQRGVPLWLIALVAAWRARFPTRQLPAGLQRRVARAWINYARAHENQARVLCAGEPMRRARHERTADRGGPRLHAAAGAPGNGRARPAAAAIRLGAGRDPNYAA